MTLTRFDMTPLLRTSIGFDRFSNLFDTVLKSGDATSPYPPYNIEKTSNDHYRIVLAVAGFKESDISITAQESQLVISGKLEVGSDSKETVFLHKGIAARAFEHKFSIADHVKVVGANLTDGLLSIELEREIPEASKPRMIPINGKKTIDTKKAN